MSGLYPNESMLSWIFRQLNSKDISAERMRTIKKIVETGFDRRSIGTAKLYEMEPAKLRGYVLMPSEFYRTQCESFWPIFPFYKRTSYCPHCLVGDMQIRHECYWRSDWENYWYVVCHHHGVRMVDIPNANYTFKTLGNKFGDAFADALKRASMDRSLVFSTRHGQLQLSPRHHASLEPDAVKSITRFKLAITSLALILQRFIAEHLSGKEVKFGCLPIVQDLMRLGMRPTTKVCDYFPLAHLLSQRLGLIKYGRTKWEDIGVDEWLERADVYSSVWIRLIAMGVTCYVLKLSLSSYWWAQVVQSCRELGHALPDSREEVYRNLLGGSYWGIRAWFERRHGAGLGFHALFGDRMYGV
ncbi:hypothetical protein FCH79_02475 [Pseudomonas koreensis]|uniref:hypothetical protein n=1 Tax=Pseudomonas koreensis TaxID=198620 RepID=UPI001577713B|nr:hypothetical protein [Pseudomonas koreensis]NTZ94186.1 hypothetical protein [Pseudomonas koreensis]